MGMITDFVLGWKDFITAGFKEHFLSASLVTLLAIGAFFLLDRTWRKGKTPSNLLLVLIGWAVLVPLLGVVISVAGKISEALEKAVGITITVIGSLYRIYEHHPLAVLAIVAVGVIGYFAWRRFWPNVVRSNALRAVSVVVGVVAAVHIIGPILDIFAPGNSDAAMAKPTEKPHAAGTPPAISTKEGSTHGAQPATLDTSKPNETQGAPIPLPPAATE